MISSYSSQQSVDQFQNTSDVSSTLRGLLIAQFFGAFNDNAWKLMVALLAIKQLASDMGMGPAFEAASQAQLTLTFVVFTLPLALGSIFAGIFSDCFSKRSIIVVMKIVEVVLMMLGMLALYFNPVGGNLPLIVLGGMGIQSALFSPAKYGILPELLSHERLSIGNGQLEMWTFLAIISGTAMGGILLQMAGASPWLAGMGLLVFSFIGLWASLQVPTVFRARSEGGLKPTLQGAWNTIQADRLIQLGIWSNIGYWTIASLVGQDILVYAKAVLELADSLAGLPLVTFGIGVGLGSVLAGNLSCSKVEVGFIPFGAIGLACGLFLLGMLSPGLFGTLLGMAWLGLASGFIVVPVNALLQWRSPQNRCGSVIALSNTFVFSGVIAGSLLSGGFSQLGFSASNILIVSGVATTLLIGWGIWLMPEIFIRMMFFVITHTVYRLKVVGRDSIPTHGGALLLTNPVSFVDSFLLLASLDRPIRFIVSQHNVNHPFYKWLAGIFGVIPIVAESSSRDILQVIGETVSHQLDAGELVCIFAPEQISGTDTILSFRKSLERILKNRKTPIIPVCLDRVWGSFFSFINGQFSMKWPKHIPYPVTVFYGSPMPSTTPITKVHEMIQDLGEKMWTFRRTNWRPLHRSFVRAARLHPLRFAFGDMTRQKVTCLESLIGAILLARALRPSWENQFTVGILLPPSVGGALVNLAATLSGRTVVNLNYTTGFNGLESAVMQSNLETIVTSQLFLTKANVSVPQGVKIILMDEIQKVIGPVDRIKAVLLAIFAPISILEHLSGAIGRPGPDDLATIIFSSGSTGEPKGIMLSHFGLDCNVDGVAQVFPLGPRDRLLGILPFFHSFGYLATIWLAVNHGVGVVYHPTPRDAETIGELIQKYHVTIVLSTPTFLQWYLHRCTPLQFRSVRIVLTGAEKLSGQLAQDFEEKFGILPIEGYGVTECSPVISVNCPDTQAAGFTQLASRQGTVGWPLPGISIRIVNPDTLEPLSAGTAGMLLVKGPNLMQGYLGRYDLTAKAMHGGWYLTGDIAILDEDGFITITDRLARFAKIGGEMISHGKIEEALHQAISANTRVFAVTSIPHEKKGEQLAVLHTLAKRSIPSLLEKYTATGLSNLFIPRKNAFIQVEKIPVLGNGKLDLQLIRQIALDALKKN